jgi:ribosomal protein S1
MKIISRLSTVGLFALCLSSAPLLAADHSTDGSTFEGRISSVDKSMNTVTVDGEKYQLLQTTRVTKNDNSSSTAELRAGQRVQGRFKRSAEDKREVLYVDIKADSNMGGAKDRVTSESGSTFRGRISRINQDRQTVRVGDRTYQVLPTTTISRAAGGTATLNQLKEDQFVTGTYKLSSEGKHELLSLEVGRPQNDR